MGFHRKINIGFLAGSLPLGELRLCEGTVGDKVHPENSGILPMPHLQTNVRPVLDHLVDLGRLTDVHYLHHSVHRTFDRMVPNANSGEATDNCLLKNWQMTKFVKFVSREANLVQLHDSLNVSSFLNPFPGAMSFSV